MPFKPHIPFDPGKTEDASTTGCACVEDNFFINDGDETGFLTILDDNDILLLVRDKPVDSHDILFLQDGDEGNLFVQDSLDKVPIDPVYLTGDQQVSLIEAGPLFQGPPGEQGPEGPSVFETWKMETGNNLATFSDFMNYLRQGLGAGQSGGTFVHIQYDPSDLWVIQHNLNKYPQIMCEDSAGESFDADYDYVNENVVEISIISPTAGKAFLN
jgi:hypothetical protein